MRIYKTGFLSNLIKKKKLKNMTFLIYTPEISVSSFCFSTFTNNRIPNVVNAFEISRAF